LLDRRNFTFPAELINVVPFSWQEATHHWAEVVWSDLEAPRMIGDMPHTWVGSDYIGVIRSLFVFERESDDALVIGLGITEEWVDSETDVVVKGLPTYYGNVSYSV